MNNPTETKKITFPGKWTKKGAQLQHHLFTIDGIKLASETINQSWSEQHWSDEFIVTKHERYLLVVVYITNTGRHQCRIDNLVWNGEKVSVTPLVDQTITFHVQLCPKCFGGQ